MRAVVVVAGVMLVSTAQSEPRVFYTAHFPDQTSIQMSVIGERAAEDDGDDFDVSIGIAKIDDVGAVTFFDNSHHHARIRCAEPSYIRFGDHRFPIGPASLSDWKQDLWKVYCETPVS